MAKCIKRVYKNVFDKVNIILVLSKISQDSIKEDLINFIRIYE
jgi:hypothetical protein